jgi:hypothetical protein
MGCTVANVSEEDISATIKVDVNKVLEENFLGVGVQWSSYPWWDISEDDWNKVFKRLEYMQMPFARVMLDAFWYCQGFDDKGKPIYTWDTAYMKKLYILLDWCQQNDVLVMIGEWGRPNGKDLDLAVDDPRWTSMIADFLEHMLEKKNYTCIKYYNLYNEPHGWWSGITWQEWKTAIDNLHREFKKRGLHKKIKLATPDADRKWTTKVLKDDQLRPQTGIYDEHWYVMNLEIQRGLLELYTRDQIRQINAKDPGKQFFLGEIGIIDDKTKYDQQLHVHDFWYGVSMADAAIQMIRGGMSGFLAWNLDDAMHFNGDGGESMNALGDTLPENAYEHRKIWGFWNIVGAEHGDPADENMRPWFYTWSALSRAFPKGCQTLEAEDAGIYQLRVAAARIPAGDDRYHVSLAVANHTDDKRIIKIHVPGISQKVSLAKYEYFDLNGDNKVDCWSQVVDEAGKDIFPAPAKTLKEVELDKGIVVELPSKGVVVMTTIETGTSVLMK